MVLFVALSVFFAAGCSTDTHYDSLSDSIAVALPKAPFDTQEVTILKRIQFDRDLVPLSNVSLVEAWLSAPGLVLPDAVGKPDATEPVAFDLSLVKSISISIVETPKVPTILWLKILRAQPVENELMSEFNVGDLRQYTDEYQRIELEIKLTLDPYHVMRFWRDVCGNVETCEAHLKFSMNFRMDE
ncbi:MAG: hypothetical protein FWC40_08225 [Proteobacteria bacterium]|nr:hypothetical protein [Pseudomonadota bacterium]